ncbi:Putative ribonuclease H protein At1g65750 [Linum perenne]
MAETPFSGRLDGLTWESGFENLDLSESVADYTNIDGQWDVEKLTNVMAPEQLNQEKLLTNIERAKRHLTEDAACEICRHPTETISHVIRDCTFATRVWRSMGFFDTETDIWKGSNDSPSAVAHRSQRWVNWVREAADRDMRNLPIRTEKQTINVAWEPGPAEWITLNSDRSFDAREGRATAGGLARDSNGRCAFAYTMNLGNCSITRAEMRGAIEGLRRAWDVGYRKVLIQLDSQTAITLLSNGVRARHQHALETAKFEELRNRDWLALVMATRMGATVFYF